MSYDFYVGVDWGNSQHQLCVLDATGTVVEERKVPHAGTGLADFLSLLIRRAGDAADRIAVAIELSRGTVVESILELCVHVYAINPKQLNRLLDSYSIAGAKDDRRDAFVLADSLRYAQSLFRRVELDHPSTIQLRELGRLRDELTEQTRRLTNRLWEQIHRVMPALLQLCSGADQPWLWSVVERAPSPDLARKLTRAQAKAILRTARVRKVTPEQVVAALRSPAPELAPGTTQAARTRIEFLATQLRLLHTQCRQCERKIDQLLEELAQTDDEQTNEHRDAEILLSLPGVGRVVAATMLGEAAQPLEQRDYHTLRTRAGAAPVTKQSGKRRDVVRRYACNPRLQQAAYHMARVNVQKDPRSKALYAALRSRGHKHGRALRTVADRLLALIVTMLSNGTLYDPNLRRVPAGAEA